MDELDQRLRARLEQLAAGVPVASETVVTTAVRPERAAIDRLGVLAAALVVVVAIVVAGGALGTIGRSAAPSPVASAAAVAPSTSVAPAPSAASTSAPSVATASPAPWTGQRYPDGIPMDWAGTTVLRGAGALAKAAAATDTAPFLVGGWLTVQYGVFSCPVQLVNLPMWASRCGAPALSDVPGTIDDNLAKAITFRLLDNGQANPVDGLASGPVIASVHVHDPRAGECGVAAATCGRLMVVDQVVWTGDAATKPRPISTAAAGDAVSSVDASSSLRPDGPDAINANCGGTLPSAQVLLDNDVRTDMPAVVSVEVLPTTAARQRALLQAEGPAGAFSESALLCEQSSGSQGTVTGSEDRWLVVANVAVLVHLHAPVTPADRTFVQRLARALAAVAASPGGSTATPLPTSAVAPCDAASILISVGRSGAAAGTVGVVLRFQNAGVAACSLVGAPAVVGVRGDGVTTTASIADQIFGMPASDGMTPIVLEPGATAYAAMAGTDVPAGASPSCPPPYAATRVTVPGGAPITLNLALPACSGILVSPFSSVEQAP